MDPREQLRAFERIEAGGWDLLGIFHSHPAGPDHPSATDIAEAAYDVVQIIWSPRAGGWNARAFSIRDGHLFEVKLYVADGEP
jgi:proteasome lid subunit RPN8/RPN11